MMYTNSKSSLTLLISLLSFFLSLGYAQDSNIPVYTYIIVNSYPHDHQAYTQGLVYEDGYIYESTGRKGESTIRKVDLETGAILQWHKLGDNFFGEGITLFRDQIIQLTWQEYTGFIYEKDSFIVNEEFYYNTEGWGITHDSTQLIMSDGTANLYFLEPGTYAIINEIVVTANGLPVKFLNELEYINGEILANVLSTDRIARIDPKTGKVTGWIDLKGLLNTLKQGYAVDVLNGIAYDQKNDRLFVTGKLWPKVFEIKVIPAVE